MIDGERKRLAVLTLSDGELREYKIRVLINRELEIPYASLFQCAVNHPRLILIKVKRLSYTINIGIQAGFCPLNRKHQLIADNTISQRKILNNLTSPCRILKIRLTGITITTQVTLVEGNGCY